MALPLVAIVGRPNVGKSALINRISQRDDAIIHEMRGVTRDRSYHKADWSGVEFMLVDTGGIEVSTDDDFQESIRAQALAAADEADIILFMVDGKVGLQADDEEVARILKRAKTPIFLIVNKMDNPGSEDGLWEFYKLGLGDPFPVSAIHGHGTGDLLDEVVAAIKSRDLLGSPGEEPAIDVAIIGRPNAGKSSLTNRLVDNERSIVSPVSGTTRDAIDTLVEHDGVLYRIVDTAGLRRKSRMTEDVEYYGFVRAMRAIDRSDVAVLVVDAGIGVTNEDQRVANYAKDRGCGMVCVLNKWDLVRGSREKAKIREDVDDSMRFASYAPAIAISALTGKGVQGVWRAVDESYENYTKTIPTSKLNLWLSDIQESGYSVTKGKTVLRIKYVTQTGVKPPRFSFFCNRPDVVTENYRRFLENRLRKAFDLKGTPIWMKFKKKD